MYAKFIGRYRGKIATDNGLNLGKYLPYQAEISSLLNIGTPKYADIVLQKLPFIMFFYVLSI
jgi:hypothetical protein